MTPTKSIRPKILLFHYTLYRYLYDKANIMTIIWANPYARHEARCRFERCSKGKRSYLSKII